MRRGCLCKEQPSLGHLGICFALRFLHYSTHPESGGQFWYGTENCQDMKRSAPAQSLHKSKSHCRQPTVNVPVTVSWQSSQMIELSSIPGSNSCPHGHLIVLPRASKKCEKWDAPRGTNTIKHLKHFCQARICCFIWPSHLRPALNCHYSGKGTSSENCKFDCVTTTVQAVWLHNVFYGQSSNSISSPVEQCIEFLMKSWTTESFNAQSVSKLTRISKSTRKEVSSCHVRPHSSRADSEGQLWCRAARTTVSACLWILISRSSMVRLSRSSMDMEAVDSWWHTARAHNFINLAACRTTSGWRATHWLFATFKYI